VNGSVSQNRARVKPPRVPITRLHSLRLRVKRKMRNEALPTTNGRECTRICETNPSPNRKDGMNGVAEAIFTKRTHSQYSCLLVCIRGSTENYQTKPSGRRWAKRDSITGGAPAMELPNEPMRSARQFNVQGLRFKVPSPA
jgi:hypothetical protein